MKLRSIVAFFLVWLIPLMALEEFDDDAFLSNRMESVEEDGLVGWTLFETDDGQERYIINFNQVSVLEYLRFVARISKINFQFEESQLNFTLTVVSEEPMAVPDIVSSFIQTLRARGFRVLEQEGTLMITASSEVNQVPAVVAPGKKAGERSPLVTKVFRIQNANLESLASIIKPMTSRTALIEVSMETRQLIVTDLTTNVERIGELIQVLDQAHSPLEIESYEARYVSAETLIAMATQLVGPFAEGNTFMFVPQPDTNTVFVVSTPHLIDRAMEVLEDLDSKPKRGRELVGDRVFLYEGKNKAASDLLEALHQIADELEESGSGAQVLISTLENAKIISDSNALMFVTDAATETKLEMMLKKLDVVSDTTNYMIYKIKYANRDQIETFLDELSDSVGRSRGNSDLREAIRTMRYIRETNSLIFTGSADALGQIKAAITSLDVPGSAASQIFLYQPQVLGHEQIEDALDELADRLNYKVPMEKRLACAIDSMSWISEAQSFLFISDPASIAEIQKFLEEIDGAQELGASGETFFIYPLKYLNGKDVIDQLQQIAKSLPEKDLSQRALVSVIEEITYLKETNSLLISGPTKAVDEVKEMIASFDSPSASPQSYLKTSFFIYKPVHLSTVELRQALHETADDLKASGLIDPSLLQSIETMKTVESTNSLIFTGTPVSLEKTKEIIESIDVPGAHVDTFPDKGHTFFIYKSLYLSPNELIKLTRNFAANLAKEKPRENAELIKALKSGQVIKESKSILFTGQPNVLEKVAAVVKQLDEPGGLVGEGPREAGTYVVYKPKNVSGPELIDLMVDFEQNLAASGVRELGLFETIQNLKYIKRTGYILVPGSKASVDQAVELLKKFDAPGMAGAGVTSLQELETSFLVYKLQYHSGEELQETLKTIGEKLLTNIGEGHQGLMNAINSLQWIKVTNSLMATGTPEVLTQLKELIENVDVPLKQVLIEALIIQTTLSNNQQFGLQWGGKVQYLSRFAGGVSNFPSPNPLSINPSTNQALSHGLAAVNGQRTPHSTDIPNPSTTAGGFDLGVIGDIILHKGRTFLNLGSLVTAIQQDSDSVVVFNPKIVAQDNQQATIFVGSNIPFTGSLVETTQTQGTQTVTNIEYRDVGITLSITPIIGTDDIVTLQISNELTDQEANTTGGLGVEGLQTSRTSINTKVHVPNRHFVALSGMIQDSKTHFKSGIPCLGGLPVIGAIFSSNDRANARENLIIFIRPEIIDSVEVFKEITDNQECLYRERASKQIIKEEIDEAIDWVKTPDDE